MFKKQNQHIDTTSFNIYIYIYITLGIFIYFGYSFSIYHMLTLV